MNFKNIALGENPTPEQLNTLDDTIAKELDEAGLWCSHSYALQRVSGEVPYAWVAEIDLSSGPVRFTRLWLLLLLAGCGSAVVETTPARPCKAPYLVAPLSGEVVFLAAVGAQLGAVQTAAAVYHLDDPRSGAVGIGATGHLTAHCARVGGAVRAGDPLASFIAEGM